MEVPICKSLNINEEYHRAVRTKSFADVYTKFQFLKDDDPSSYSHNPQPLTEQSLLEPAEETITSILASTKLPKLKTLLHSYFVLSSEASNICSHLLKNINFIQSHYQEIQRTLFNSSNDTDTISTHSLAQKIVPELNSLVILKNPFPDPKNDEFKLIREKYTCLLHRLQLNNRKVARRIKLIKWFNKASGVCVTLAFGLVTTAAIILAIHGFGALVMGPVILCSLPVKHVRKRFKHVMLVIRPRFLSKVGEQLNVAAKGTYVLNRDLDTMSRLVSRVHDEIEHNREVIQLCLERKGDGVFTEEMVSELKKSHCGMRKHVEELEEHVYLCLLTINRASALVVQEIAPYINLK